LARYPPYIRIETPAKATVTIVTQKMNFKTDLNFPRKIFIFPYYPSGMAMTGPLSHEPVVKDRR
jgi:hypothetical protein